jgi:hypothetical protein
MASSSATQAFITAHWSDIAVINYEADPQLLRRFLPAGLELARYSDHHLLSLVSFRYRDTRMGGVRVPFYGQFIELYLGFFAQHERRNEIHRGWVFIKKIVPGRVIAATGRILYNEEYIRRPMRELIEHGTQQRPYRVRYEWKDGGSWHGLEVRASALNPQSPAEGSVEHYVTQNYGAFAKTKRGGTIEFPADHPTWDVWPSEYASLDGDAERIFDADIAGVLKAPHHSAFIASGSHVSLGKATSI